MIRTNANQSTADVIRAFEACREVLSAGGWDESQLNLFRDWRNDQMLRFGEALERETKANGSGFIMAVFSNLNRAKDPVDAILYPEEWS
jgi:hypothetical protein